MSNALLGFGQYTNLGKAKFKCDSCGESHKVNIAYVPDRNSKQKCGKCGLMANLKNFTKKT